MSYSVGQIARLAGVSVRTLHHYHRIGLLSPAVRTGAGYRQYGEAELQRLQQIMFYRELGFALDEITVLLRDPDADPLDHLRRQHTMLVRRADRVRAMVAAVERAMEAHRMGIALTPEDRFEVFGPDDPGRYADEVEQRWGDTDAYAQSRRRTKDYTKQDWIAIKQEVADIETAYADAMAAGAPPDSETATAAAEQHRQHINARFYDCSPEFHRNLAEMYVTDSRFAGHYEARASGLAQYVRDAINANSAQS
jgi:MerR family transcriptional regulator, thiopeptide resistance regulator